MAGPRLAVEPLQQPALPAWGSALQQQREGQLVVVLAVQET